MNLKILRQIIRMSSYLFYGIFLQVLFTSLLIAKESGGQSRDVGLAEIRVTIESDGHSLKSIFREIERQTDFKFNYHSKSIISRKLSIDAQDASLKEVLTYIAVNERLHFKRINENINVKKVDDSSAEVEEIITDIERVTVSGTITSAVDGEPLPGVSILIKGTSVGTISDINGAYTINTESEDILQFSFIGYESQEILVGNRTTIDVVLEEDLEQLEEVVVVGYGTQRKADLTGSVVRVTTEETTDLPNFSVLQSIQGRVPGVNITSPERPGQDPSLNIRGNNSLTASNSPLIVVDGIIYWGSISDFNPNDIETIDILKDASATAVYGSRAANGVLLITTKKGRTEKPRFNFNAYYGIDQAAGLIDVMDGERYLEKTDDYNEILLSNNPDASLIELTNIEKENLANGRETDWVDLSTRTGAIQNYHLSVSGNTDKTNYYIAGNYFSHEGIALNDQFERTTLNMNLTNDITDWFTISVKSALSSKDYSGVPANLFAATAQSPYGAVFDEDGPGGYAFLPIGDPLGINPLIPTLIDNEDKRLSLWGVVSSKMSIPFIEGLTWTLNYSNNFRRNLVNQFTNNTISNAAEVQNGIAFKRKDEFYDWTLDNIINYRKTFADKHSVDFTLLLSRENRNLDFTTARASNFVSQSLGYNNLGLGAIQESSSNLEEQSAISQMARVNYGFDDRYALTLTFRRDGFSAFAAGNKYANFPAVAAAWTLSNETFMQNINWLDYLKLRLSYGKNGNQGINRYSSLARISTDQYIFGNGGTTQATYNVASLANSDLTWETTTSSNIGVDFRLFEGVLSGSVDAYISNTENLLQSRTLPRTSGFASVLTNIGETENKGVEISLNSVNVQKTDFNWTSGLVFSMNRSRIVSLSGIDADNDGVEDDDISNGWFIDEDPNVIFGFKTDGLYQLGDDIPDGFRPGDFRLVDVNNDGEFTPEDRVILGLRNPGFIWALTNTVSYKRFSLYVMVNSVVGGGNGNFYVGNNYATRSVSPIGNTTYTERFNVQDVPYWTPNNPTNEYPRLDYNPVFPHPIIESRSFVRIQDVTLSYNFSDELLSRWSINNLRLYTSIKNLYTFTNWSGYNPETASTIRDIPFLRNYTVGINLSF